MKDLIKEFKEFILRGNVVDMAVGVVVGNSFKSISTSLVDDIIMPAVGMLLGKVEFTDLEFVLQQEVLNTAGDVLVPSVAIRYGEFIQTIIDFLIVAAAVFVMIKVISVLSTIRLKEQAKEEAVVEEVKEEVVEEVKPTSEELLAEIRDLLKNK